MRADKTVLLALLLTGNAASAQPMCGGDSLGVRNQPQILQAARGLTLDFARIRFQACRNHRFSTAMNEATITINYPADLKAATDAIGALTHELAHAYQLTRSGGFAQLRSQLGGSTERMELGADFLAGYVFHHYLTGVSRAAFQTSIELSAAYDDAAGLSYGTPEDRTIAFRMGFYYPGAAKNVEAANVYFQRDGFGSLKANKP
jgi:hypothetical protein